MHRLDFMRGNGYPHIFTGKDIIIIAATINYVNRAVGRMRLYLMPITTAFIRSAQPAMDSKLPCIRIFKLAHVLLPNLLAFGLSPISLSRMIPNERRSLWYFRQARILFSGAGGEPEVERRLFGP